jgi:hypothetical protein
MMRRLNVSYAGRSVFVWGNEQNIPLMLADTKKNADAVHSELPHVILEGAVFEIVTRSGVETLAVPKFVFAAFGLPVQARNFDYDKMLFPDGTFKDKWGVGKSVPDLTQLEVRALKSVKVSV